MTACHKGPSNQWSVTGRRRWVASAAQGLDDSGATGACRRPPLPAPPCRAEGPRAEVPEPSRRGPCCFRTSCSRVRARAGRGWPAGQGTPSAWGSGRPNGEQLRVPFRGGSGAAWRGRCRALATFAGRGAGNLTSGGCRLLGEVGEREIKQLPFLASCLFP